MPAWCPGRRERKALQREGVGSRDECCAGASKTRTETRQGPRDTGAQNDAFSGVAGVGKGPELRGGGLRERARGARARGVQGPRRPGFGGRGRRAQQPELERAERSPEGTLFTCFSCKIGEATACESSGMTGWVSARKGFAGAEREGCGAAWSWRACSSDSRIRRLVMGQPPRARPSLGPGPERGEGDAELAGSARGKDRAARRAPGAVTVRAGRCRRSARRRPGRAEGGGG